MLAITFHRLIGNRLTVEPNLAAFRFIETSEKFDERGLAAAVSSSDKDQLTALKRQIEGTESKEAIFLFMVIRMRDTVYFQVLPFRPRQYVCFAATFLGRQRKS